MKIISKKKKTNNVNHKKMKEENELVNTMKIQYNNNKSKQMNCKNDCSKLWLILSLYIFFFSAFSF